MKMPKIVMMSLVGLSLALGACDKGDAGKDTKKTAAKVKDAKAKGKDAKKDVKDAKDVKSPDGAGEEDEAEAEVEDKFDDRVVKAAGLANKIDKEPARADEILAEAKMDRAAFEALLYEISTPELAEQYRLARARES